MSSRTKSRRNSGSVPELVSYDSPVTSRSLTGDMSRAAAGSGRPRDRARSCTVIASQPPTESPAKAMWPGSVPCSSSQR